MGIILLPYVAESIANRQLQKANQLINKLALIYLVSALFFTAVIYVFIGFLTSFFFADNYLVTTELSRIIILAVLPQAIYLLYRNPIDAISVIPYNTIILGVSLITMILAFKLSTTINQFAWSYVVVSMLQGVLSMATWHLIKQPYKA
jgi:O-antigen/teichoic acid export membrane protein